jgi:hypothetical protein
VPKEQRPCSGFGRDHKETPWSPFQKAEPIRPGMNTRIDKMHGRDRMGALAFVSRCGL